MILKMRNFSSEKGNIRDNILKDILRGLNI